MAQAPPTPPPMSATELRDEARDSIIASSAESSDPTVSSNSSGSAAEIPPQLPAAQDIYQQIFPQLSDLAEQRNFIGITNIAELHDLNGSNDKSYSRLLLIAPLVLAYMVLDDLTPAQHALARLPENVSLHPLSRALAALLASASERKYENTYSRAQELFQMSQQSDFPDPRLGKTVGLLVNDFLDAFRKNTFTLVSRAFACLHVTEAQKLLGLGRKEVLAIANNNHWQFDSASGILRPPNASLPALIASKPVLPSSVMTFDLVVNGVTTSEVY
ncbi:hypothetical protein DEU56DRAFT_765070 [Suillus clintonianus]|uniref:uncharacterized protein n=1 Tax=Suillus clintonianus TaxID=1904413 RepID=UPI001B87C830|nr:uncharacterized protein DEU56DRAFT_765070 [Suillus clintonianus]KAG2157521.1 hypothetical protein DEU56DRAFT_765070 [Suillus clintonianus]